MMTDEVRVHPAADRPANDEKRYPDPYDLYRLWFGTAEDGSDEDSVSFAELRELWKRWFEATTGAAEIENGFVSIMAPLWSEMAQDISARMLSREDLPEDPIKFFLRWYGATSEKWSKTADDLLKKDEVLEAMSRFFETYARSHGQLRHASEEGLKNLRLPARSDVARVARLVRTVEDKVDRIEEAFEEFIYGDAEPATAGAVGGLEERMDRLEGKMDRILAALKELGAGGTSRGTTTKKATGKPAAPHGYA